MPLAVEHCDFKPPCMPTLFYATSVQVSLQKIENSYISLYLLLPFPLPFPILEVYWFSTASISFDSIDAKFNKLHCYV